MFPQKQGRKNRPVLKATAPRRGGDSLLTSRWKGDALFADRLIRPLGFLNLIGSLQKVSALIRFAFHRLQASAERVPPAKGAFKRHFRALHLGHPEGAHHALPAVSATPASEQTLQQPSCTHAAPRPYARGANVIAFRDMRTLVLHQAGTCTKPQCGSEHLPACLQAPHSREGEVPPGHPALLLQPAWGVACALPGLLPSGQPRNTCPAAPASHSAPRSPGSGQSCSAASLAIGLSGAGAEAAVCTHGSASHRPRLRSETGLPRLAARAGEHRQAHTHGHADLHEGVLRGGARTQLQLRHDAQQVRLLRLQAQHLRPQLLRFPPGLRAGRLGVPRGVLGTERKSGFAPRTPSAPGRAQPALSVAADVTVRK